MCTAGCSCCASCCVSTRPPPANDDLAFGEELKRTLPTERARAEKRGQVPRCKTCHGFIDPLGVPFEHYDTLGRFRAEIPTAMGAVPVDASWDLDVYDVKGRVENAVQLAGKLAESKAVRSCLVRQIASYAYGARLLDEQMWATQPILAKFDAADGNLLELVKAVARWPSLVVREDAP